VLALLDEDGFKLTLRQANAASAADVVAGHCLTVGAEVLANYPGDSPQSLATTAASLAMNAAQLLLIQQIEPLLHIMDAGLAYAIGVVQAMGALVMSQNMARCNPPTFNLASVLRCACDDFRLQIPAPRRAEGLEQGALWCTGVLSMIDGNRQPYYIYNKYTYRELQTFSAGLDAYAECVGSVQGAGYSCQPPPTQGEALEFFRQQGVTVPNVLVKCRENFVKKQWDPYAFVYYNRAYHHLSSHLAGQYTQFPSTDPRGIRACLQLDPTTGGLAQRCLQAFLDLSKTLWEDYWAYERAGDLNNEQGSQYTDACMVFSGPAASGVPLFTDCVDGVGDGRCILAGHAWSPLSENQVPVGGQHRVLSHGAHSNGLVQQLYSAARSMVLQAVEASLALQRSDGSSHLDIQIFSVEGDVLHQTMDCMFMGPYSRVDYWPIPACDTADECLTGPFWARGDDGGRGVDPDACASQPTLPYTCGSPARQALMRYLVKDVLPKPTGNVTVIHETVVGTLEQVRADWANTSLYGCACADRLLGFAPGCCAGYTGPLLPQHLNNSYMPLNSSRVMEAMEDDLGVMYSTAMRELAPWLTYLDTVAPGERAKYNAWSRSQRVHDEARFNPTQPVKEYASASESLTPLMDTGSTLWGVCHAALKQTFFTLPLGGAHGVAFDPDLSEFDGDPGKLRDYVRNFTFEAWRHSPLFRHYSPRHVPSESGMCAAPPEPAPPADATMAYRPLVQMQTATLLRTDELPASIPAYSSRRFRVGEASCLCGWSLLPGGRCRVPQTGGTDTHLLVCGTVAGVCSPETNFTYRIEDEPKVLAEFSAAWHCPEFELSPHWGITDASAAEEWLAANGSGAAAPLWTSTRDLLQHGRAGTRLGNVWGLGALAKQSINPKTRAVPLEHGRLRTCDAATAPVEELFPAAQAAEEAGAVAYCLRYVLELARLEALELAVPGGAEAALQKERTALWRRRCGAQLHLLHLCTNLGVYGAAASEGSACPHFRLPSNDPLVQLRRAYVTPECLVGVDGGAAFYDPCRCVECVGDRASSLDLRLVLDKDRCRLRFDPRRESLLDPGAAIGWIDGAHPLPDPSLLLRRQGFARELLDDPDAAGNTDGEAGPWWQTEGLMQNNSEFCDGVLDWWPEEWDHPVGYHVTVPCEANDTAYRSFVQAFGLEGGELVYQHDLLRDASLADSHFGIGGLCRRGSFGMPLFETNTMAYCTSMPDGASEDFTVPWSDEGGKEWAGKWTSMKCAPSSRSLPWPSFVEQGSQRYDASLFSVGTVPHMPREYAATYPETATDMSELGPWQEVIAAGAAWGTRTDTLCQDFDLALCAGDGGCPGGYRCRGMVCSGGDFSTRCAGDGECPGGQTCGGVCMDAATSDCIRHSDCSAALMCSGVGICVQPTLVVQNRLPRDGDNNVSFSLQAAGPGGCGESGQNFSLVGGSYWGNVAQDLLRVHGMCSFEDWFKYTRYYSGGECATQQSDGSLRVDPRRCQILDLNTNLHNQSKWWPPSSKRPELMYLRPTNCDRDYERLKNFTQCAPLLGGGAKLRYADNTLADVTANNFNTFVRLHESDGGVRLADMPERNDTHFGGLGLGGVVKKYEDLKGGGPEHPYLPCSLVGQCYAPPFTVNGLQTNRTYVNPKNMYFRLPYDDAVVFKCGVFGLDDDGGCRLDTEVLPLYRALCVPASAISQCKALVPGGVGRLCENIRLTYQANNLQRTTNLQGLKALFYAFPAFDDTDVDAYLNTVDCMLQLHTAIQGTGQSRGMYFPFMFVLKELPFDWFYQCIVMGGLRVNENAWRPQDCTAYSERALHTLADYQSATGSGDSLGTYLRYVRGGYRRATVVAFQNAQLLAVTAAVQSARMEVRDLLYPVEKRDQSYPVCSKNLVWKIGPYGEAYSASDPVDTALRAIIVNWYDPQECKSDWLTRLLQQLQPSQGIAADNWATMLSTFDPVNVEPQALPDTTLLDLTERFMLRDVGVRPVANILAKATGGLYFFKDVPQQYDLLTAPVPQNLIPAPSWRQGEMTTDSDPTLNRTCAYPPSLDPAFRAWRGTPMPCEIAGQQQALNRRDTLKQCNQKMCTSVPVVAKKMGQFKCRYQAAGSILPPCSEDSSDQQCYVQVLAAIYAKVLSKYQLTAAQEVVALPAEPLPWFDAGGRWEMANFNLSDELDYDRNIQPNPEQSIMCDLTAKSKAIKYTECNSPHYAKLKAHANAHYRKRGAVVVPAGGQLEWPVDRALLTRGLIMSYARVTRPLNQTYLDGLLDDSTVCKGAVVETQRVCWKRGALDITSVNPWLLGRFNPFDACDVEWTDSRESVQEYVYSQCQQQDNPRCAEFLATTEPSRCKSLDRMLVSFPGVPRTVAGRSLDYNLCYHRIEEDAEGCLHNQGLLGGYDGSPVALGGLDFVSMLADTKYEAERYNVGDSLYEESDWAIPSDMAQGFYASGANPLWQGGEAPYGHLQANDMDIGGHSVGLVVALASASDKVGTLLVERLPLTHRQPQGFLDQSATRPTSQWVGELQADMQADDDEIRRLHGPRYATADLAASCPLQRWMHYSGGYAAFSPAIPSALRAQRMFHRIHNGKLSHPTMTRARRGEFLGRYLSANGFCACPVFEDTDQPQCRIASTAVSTLQCSLAQTIRSLKADGDPYFTSYTFTPRGATYTSRQCAMQLDWPNVNGTLRDGSVHEGEWSKASSPINRECHVLDRFTPFRYRYKMMPGPLSQTPPGATTLSAGVCQTARVVTLQRGKIPPYARCLRTSPLAPDSPAMASFTCNQTLETPLSMPRAARLTVQETLARTRARRSRCGRCAPPPRFRTAAGAPMQPESSFGRLYRASTEKTLARDLREALGAACAANETAWRPGEFMRNYLFAPQRLCRFRSDNTTAPTTAPSSVPPSSTADAKLWGEEARPWVYCPNTEALKTGEGCKGSMRRADWVQNKATLCPRLVRDYSSSEKEDPLARTPFCNLDNTTDLVCKAVAGAKLLVAQANCIARGDNDCMPSPYVYHPASYEPSNNAWVHDSVEAFYLKINASSCPAAATAAQQGGGLLNFARKYQLTCPANALYLVKQILVVVRVVVTDVALLLSSVMSLGVKLLALLVTGNTNKIKDSVLDEWQYIRSKGGGMVRSVSDLLVDAMLNSGTLGARIMGFLDAACENINSGITWFLQVW
jgi:hypothetical protein